MCLSILFSSYFVKSQKYSEIQVVLLRGFKIVWKYSFLILLLFFSSCLIGKYKHLIYIANNLFCNSSPYYYNMPQTFKTVFSLTFGDSIFKILSYTYEQNKLTTLIYILTHWLIFTAIFLRLYLLIIEEVFKSIKSKSHLYWLDSHVSSNDYVKMEVLLSGIVLIYKFIN